MIAYILKSSVSLLILFGLYWFLLRKEKIFVFNRYFLVTSVVFSLVVPFLSIPVNFQVAPQINNIIPAFNYAIADISKADNIVTGDANISQSSTVMNSPAVSISAILLALYISGVILFLIRFLKNLYMIIRKSKLSEKINLKGYRIVLTKDTASPCCFFKNIFLNSDDYLNDRIDKELIVHELAHSRQSHTIDIVLIELLKIFYWFNPVLVLYDRAIRINHEYLADNGVINDNPDVKTYAEKLLNFVAGKSNVSLTSGSNYSFIKKRLLMLTKTKSGSSVHSLRITVTLSLILIFSLLISFKQTAGPESRNINQRSDIMVSDHQDTLKPNISHANTMKEENKIITLKGDVVIGVPDINNIYNIIKVDSARYDRNKNIIEAYNGTIEAYNSGENHLIKSISFNEMNYDITSRKVTIKNITANFKIKNEDTLPVYEEPERFPIKKSDSPKLTRNFGEKSIKTLSNRDSLVFHYGIDIEAKYGTEVLATAGGKVIKASWDSNGFGNLIEIDHGGGYQSRYAHLKDFNVKNGDSVTKGQIIGHVGSSGLSTGPHLHFEILSNGETVNPLTYLK